MSDSSSSSSSDFPLLDQLSDWESDEESDVSRSYKERVNYWNVYEDFDFYYRFRLSKTAIDNLLTEIMPFLKVTPKTQPWYHTTKQTTADIALLCIVYSKSSASNIVRDVSRAIAKLYPSYIYVHDNTQEDFYNFARFPGELGAVDGTHYQMFWCLEKAISNSFVANVNITYENIPESHAINKFS